MYTMPYCICVWLLRWQSGKEPACQCRRYKRCGFHSWVRKILWRRKWLPTPVFLPGEPHGQMSVLGYSPWGGRVGHDWAYMVYVLYLYTYNVYTYLCVCMFMYRLIYLYLLIYHICVCIRPCIKPLTLSPPHNSGKLVQIRKLRHREVTLPKVTQCPGGRAEIRTCPGGRAEIGTCFPWHHAACLQARRVGEFRIWLLSTDCAQILAHVAPACLPCTAFFCRDFTSCYRGGFPTVS